MRPFDFILRTVRRATALLLLLTACDFEPRPVKTVEGHSRIWPPGSGKVVSFGIEPDPGAAVAISSHDVHAQERKGKLVLNFLAVAFDLGEKQLQPVALERFTIRVLGPDAKTVLAQSAARDLDDHYLTPEKPRHITREFEVAMADVLAECDPSCVISISADYFPATAHANVLGMRKREGNTGTAASTPVSLQLGSGKAARWQPPAQEPVQPAAAPATAIASACSLLSQAEATQILGRTMQYAGVSNAGRCGLDSPSGGGALAFTVAYNEPLIDRAMQGAQNVESLFLGDRSIWLPKESRLLVEDGRMRYTVTTAGPNAQRDAEAIAQRLIINGQQYK